jgi:hypothetical protein
MTDLIAASAGDTSQVSLALVCVYPVHLFEINKQNASKPRAESRQMLFQHCEVFD